MRRDVLWFIVFWGALWGLTEATVGYFLHLLPVNIGWLFWFPIAFFFMARAWRDSGRPEAAFGAALLAASVKLTNLMNAVPVDRVINPAAAIVFEGLGVYAVFYLLSRSKQWRRNPLTLSFAASLAWRALFAVYLLLIPTNWPPPGQLTGLGPFLNFLLFESGVNALCIWPVLILTPRRRSHLQLAVLPVAAVVLLGLSIVAQLVV
ncbi:MAG: hypothetical protein ACM3QZ_13775 [Solirubrobacterales bacterium]